jgi:hypothetical protein
VGNSNLSHRPTRRTCVRRWLRTHRIEVIHIRTKRMARRILFNFHSINNHYPNGDLLVYAYFGWCLGVRSAQTVSRRPLSTNSRAIAALQQSLHGRSERSMEEAVRERKQARDKIAEYFNEKRSRHPEYKTELRDLLGYRWRTGLAVIELAVR